MDLRTASAASAARCRSAAPLESCRFRATSLVARPPSPAAACGRRCDGRGSDRVRLRAGFRCCHLDGARRGACGHRGGEGPRSLRRRPPSDPASDRRRAARHRRLVRVVGDHLCAPGAGRDLGDDVHPRVAAGGRPGRRAPLSRSRCVATHHASGGHPRRRGRRAGRSDRPQDRALRGHASRARGRAGARRPSGADQRQRQRTHGSFDPALVGIDRVVLAWSGADPAFVRRLLVNCRRHEIKLSVVSPFRGQARPALRLSQVADLPVLEYNTADVPRSTAALKRGFDVIVAGRHAVGPGAGARVVALAIKLDDRGPVLFRQPRAGRNGKPFTMHQVPLDGRRRRAAPAGARRPGRPPRRRCSSSARIPG